VKANQVLIRGTQEINTIVKMLAEKALGAAEEARQAKLVRANYEREAEKQLRGMMKQALAGIRNIVAIAKSSSMQSVLIESEKVSKGFDKITFFEIIMLEVKKPEYMDWAWLSYDISLSFGDVMIEVGQHHGNESMNFSLAKPTVDIDNYGTTKRISRAMMLDYLMSLHQGCERDTWSPVTEYEALHYLLGLPTKEFLSIIRSRKAYSYRDRLHWLALLIRCEEKNFLEHLLGQAIAAHTKKLQDYASSLHTT
jgi:hypothetical protein